MMVLRPDVQTITYGQYKQEMIADGRIKMVVAMWLICNEIISILENIQDMGVKIPAFLQPLVKHIRSQVEEQINTEKIEEKDSEGE